MVRYVILTQGRTGSTMLTRMLGRHQQVVCWDEVFNTNFDPGRRPKPSRGEALRFWLSRGDPAKVPAPRPLDDPETIGADRILDEYIWHERYAPEVRAVGFKVLWFQMRREGNFPRLRERLAERLPEAAAIFIGRENLLRLLLSQEAAKAAGQWHLFAERDRRPRSPLHFAPQELIRGLERCRRADRNLLELAACAGRACRLTYERLVADRAGCWRDVEELLGVAPRALPPLDLLKIENRPLRRAIANYDELKRALAGTEWGRYFDE